jgi:hypothetical protein
VVSKRRDPKTARFIPTLQEKRLSDSGDRAYDPEGWQDDPQVGRDGAAISFEPHQVFLAPFMPPIAADALLASDNERPAAPSASTSLLFR